MEQLLLWLYLADAVLLITHEIDSAYWKEWNLFYGLLPIYGRALRPFQVFAEDYRRR